MEKAATAVRDTLVIIPMYNEKENAAAIIDAVMSLEGGYFDILVVDDNSPDGTATIVKNKIAQYPERVHILEREGKLGLGTAYIEGFKWALQRNYKYICEMDADFSHDPNDLLRLRETVADNIGDVAVGSRYVSGVNVVNWPIGRVLMSYYASAYVKLVTGMRIHDTTAGFVCYRRCVLEDMNLDSIKFKGYAFQIEMKFSAYNMKYRVVEIPIVFVNRRLGTSKMNSGIFGEALFGVIRLRWDSLFHNKKRR